VIVSITIHCTLLERGLTRAQRFLAFGCGVGDAEVLERAGVEGVSTTGADSDERGHQEQHSSHGESS
jgi:hypothetical protein